jgi:hypothetical protein
MYPIVTRGGAAGRFASGGAPDLNKLEKRGSCLIDDGFAKQRQQLQPGWTRSGALYFAHSRHANPARLPVSGNADRLTPCHVPRRVITLFV